jgi:hypothetical protein
MPNNEKRGGCDKCGGKQKGKQENKKKLVQNGHKKEIIKKIQDFQFSK